MRILSVCLCVFISLLLSNPMANGQVVRKAGQLILNKVFKEAGEEALETASKKLLREAGESALQRTAKSTGRSVLNAGLRKTTMTAGRKVLREGGEQAVTAVSRLTARNARRLAMMEKELVASGKAPEVMSLLARHGKADQLVDFMWRNKGTLATGAVVTALIANPDSVLGATGDLAGKVIETSGKHIAQPLIKETAEPVVKSATTGLIIGSTVLSVFGGLALYLRWGRKGVCHDRS